MQLGKTADSVTAYGHSYNVYIKLKKLFISELDSLVPSLGGYGGQL